MARTRKGRCAGTIAGVVLTGLTFAIAARGEEAAPVPIPLSKACQVGDTATATEHPLPNVAEALKTTKSLRILAIGAAGGLRGTRGSYIAQIERLLAEANKGLQVVTINRGVSGELAADASRRIRIEVALNDPNLVLWQVGTNDALAYVPLDEHGGNHYDSIPLGGRGPSWLGLCRACTMSTKSNRTTITARYAN